MADQSNGRGEGPRLPGNDPEGSRLQNSSPPARRKVRPSADPDRRLRHAIGKRGSAQLRARIRGLGKDLYRYIQRGLARARVEDLAADTEDVYSDFLLRVLRRIENRDAADIESVGWFLSAARSALGVFLTKRTRDWALGVRVDVDSRDSASMERVLAGEAAIDAGAVGDGALERTLALHLPKLTRREREVLVNALVLRYPTERIAREMNLKVGSVRTLRYNALRKLRDCLSRAERRRE